MKGTKAASKIVSVEVVQPMRERGKDPRRASSVLLKNIKKALPKLRQIAIDCDAHWGSEDRIYRFYHQSFKVFHIQSLTADIVKKLRALNPKKKAKLNEWFEQIVSEGTGKDFKLDYNADWPKHARPLVEAYFHARYFLAMVIKYGEELDVAPSMLPSGWAAVLSLYDMR